MSRAPTIAGVAAIALSGAGIIAAARGENGQHFALVERGRYLASVADCAACHTSPGVPRPFAGGRSIETPFGNLVAPNITPDRETGIGAWTDDQFDTAVRKGAMPDGSRLYPAMPYVYYSKMSRDDVLAIRAYLKTVEPVNNPVTSNTLPFPFNIRMTMRVWNWLYFDTAEFKADTSRSAEWNHGAWLVQGPAHCGACHTPKSFLGGDKSARALQGYRIQGWFAPDITSGNGALANWTPGDVIEYLHTGHNKFAAAGGPMAEEVAMSSSKMSDGDLKAIATYLKDVSAPAKSKSSTPAQDLMTAGAAIYTDLCSSCHKSGGKGVPRLIPDLSENASLKGDDPTTALRVILQGAQSVATDTEPTSPAMPSFGWQLSDEQVAAVATYVRNSFGNSGTPVTAENAQHARHDLQSRADTN
jgi:mono/diheme cytochrome c family protein